MPFDQVKKKVEEAWYLNEARVLAAKAAEDIAQKARKSGTPVPELVEAAKGEPLIDIDGIARFTGKSSRARMDYSAYRIPEDKIEYPSKNFVTNIVELKNVNDVTVLDDRPKKTFYVVAVTHRNPPSAAGSEFREGGLLPYFEAERQNTYRRSVLARLRQEARLE